MRGKTASMADIRKIIHYLRLGYSKRQIHREFGVNRPLIRKLHNLALLHDWLDPDQPMPSDEEIEKACPTKIQNQSHPFDAYKEQIEEWHQKGYSSVVIHRLLNERCPCDVQAVRRYRKKHFPKPIEPVMVRPTVPGRDLELDFGELGKFLDKDNTLKRVWLFSLRLRHSRKAYREIVFDQKLHTFLMGHVHAFEHFNGVPEKCIPDNLKAAVIKSVIDNDMVNRTYQELAEHYGFIISPCLPRTPEHKGGVEGDVKYVKRNFLPYFKAKQKEKGIEVPKVVDLVEALKKWEADVADTRIIQGVGRSPQSIFESEEQAALKPLPKDRWDMRLWSQCQVRKDWRILNENAYYSVPYQLIGERVEVCTTVSFVRIFHNSKEVALHLKATEKWEYQRKAEHAPPFQEAVLQCNREGLLELARSIGSFTYEVAHAILSHPSVDKLRPVRNLLKLREKYSNARLEKACQRAFKCKNFSYLSVKSILEKNLDSQPIEDSNTDKVVPLSCPRFARDPSDYTSCKSETFEETLSKMHPRSKYGNAMMGAYEGLLADQIVEEAERSKKGGDDV